jgi:hypothetical protein
MAGMRTMLLSPEEQTAMMAVAAKVAQLPQETRESMARAGMLNAQQALILAQAKKEGLEMPVPIPTQWGTVMVSPNTALNYDIQGRRIDLDQREFGLKQTLEPWKVNIQQQLANQEALRDATRKRGEDATADLHDAQAIALRKQILAIDALTALPDDTLSPLMKNLLRIRPEAVTQFIASESGYAKGATPQQTYARAYSDAGKMLTNSYSGMGMDAKTLAATAHELAYSLVAAIFGKNVADNLAEWRNSRITTGITAPAGTSYDSLLDRYKGKK